MAGIYVKLNFNVKKRGVKVSFELINYDDIVLFDVGNSTCKANNDKNNKKRESILEVLGNASSDSPCLQHPKWRDLYIKFQTLLRKLGETTVYDKLKVSKKAGRRFNYDFLVTYYNEDNVVHEIKLEFKNNKEGTIDTLPQVLSIQVCKKAKVQIVSGERYDEYFYKNYLDSVIQNYPIELQKPPLSQYETLISKTDYKCNHFFDNMYKHEACCLHEKSSIVDESIMTYLNRSSLSIKYGSLQDKLMDAIFGKTFIIWTGTDFMDYKFSEFTLESAYEIKNNNTIVIKTMCGTYSVNSLLRWRNHKGILNPAFQISIRHIK